MVKPALEPLKGSHGPAQLDREEFANPKLRLIAAQAKVFTSQSLIRSIILEITAWLILLSSVCAVILFIWILPNFLFLLLIVLIVLVIALFCFSALPQFFRFRRLAKRHRIAAHGDLRRDRRDPVLYLRTFSSDFSSDPERISGVTDEELLTSVLQDIGPVVAIGDPKDGSGPDKALPMLGTSRIYFNDDAWQTSVEQLMSMSQLVVFHTATSQWLIWEMEAAAKRAGPSKLLISFLDWQSLNELERQEKYERYKVNAENVLNKSLSGKRIRLPDSIEGAAFLAFGDHWTPRLIRVNEWKRRFYSFSFSILLRETLRPFFRERHLKVSLWRTILYAIPMVLFCYGLACPLLWIGLASRSITPSLFIIIPAFMSYAFLFLVILYKSIREEWNI